LLLQQDDNGPDGRKRSGVTDSRDVDRM